jgi:hypothetical protein
MRPSSRIAVGIAVIACAAAVQDPKPLDTTLGQKPPDGAVVLFDGTNLDGWLRRDGQKAAWPIKAGAMTCGKGLGDILTKDTFGDYKLHVEFNVPLMPDAKGQARGNSGVYQVGSYEVQVLDSYGLKMEGGDCGSIYRQVVPKYNVCKPPLQWQTYDITFHKARVQDGKVSEKARITVMHNGVVTIDNAAIDPTPGGVSVDLGENGPILLQDHGNEVQYRNIWLLPLKD